MLDPRALDTVLTNVASATMKDYAVSRVVSEPTADSEGQDALRIRVVYSGQQRYVDGDLALDTIIDLNEALQQRKDERTAIVTFVREDELNSHDDPEA